MLAATTVSRPARLASNSARSAEVNSASNVSPFTGAVATPMDSVTDIACPFDSRSGIGSAAVMRRTSSANSARRLRVEAGQEHHELVAGVAAHVLPRAELLADHPRHQA